MAVPRMTAVMALLLFITVQLGETSGGLRRVRHWRTGRLFRPAEFVGRWILGGEGIPTVQVAGDMKPWLQVHPAT